MSYASLLAEAIHYSPAQEGAGALVDAIGTANWTPSGAPTYGVPGPTAWLPDAVNISSATNDQFNFVIPADLLTVTDFTFFLWLRRTTAGGAQQRILADPLNLYFLLTPPVLNLQAGGSLNSQSISDQLWHGVAMGYNGATNVPFIQLDAVRDDGVLSAFAGFIASTMLMSEGGNRLNADVAGITFWERLLTSDEINEWMAGPISSSTRRGKRGSGKVRKVRR